MPVPERRYCVSCAGRGYTVYDLDALNRMPRELPCSECGGNPNQPWRLRFINEHYVFVNEDTGEQRRYAHGVGWPDA